MAGQRETSGSSRAPDGTPVSCLTVRQAEVLRLAADGLSGKQIARHLAISLRTVEGHFSGMRRRTGAHSDGELIAYAVAAGLFTPGAARPPRVPDRGRKLAAGQSRKLATEINVDKRSPGVFGHKLIGYVWVPADGQSPSQQIGALLRAGVDRGDIHLDVAGGAEPARPGLGRLLSLLGPGDTLAVTRLDQLSCSLARLVTLGASMLERGIGLRVIEQGIDTATAEGHAMLGMLSVLAELQRDPTAAGARDVARARGHAGGRRPRLTPDQAALAQRLYDARDKTVQQIADVLDVPRSTIYGYLSQSRTVRSR